MTSEFLRMKHELDIHSLTFSFSYFVFFLGKKIYSAVLKVSQKAFARKISQITIVEENNIMISLSGSHFKSK
jgi:hypothetical protein